MITALDGNTVSGAMIRRADFAFVQYGQGFSKILTMMKPSESQVLVEHGQPMGRNELQNAHRNFNMNQ